MHSFDPAYARTGAFRDSGIPGIPRAVATQCRIIPNALARIFRHRSTIIAAGLLALTVFAMMPVDNAQAQTGVLSLADDDAAEGPGSNYDYDNPNNADISPTYGTVPIRTGASRDIHIDLDNVATNNTPTIRMQFIGLGRRANVTNTGATFPERHWTLTLKGIVSGNTFVGVPASSSRFVEGGRNRAFGRSSGPDMVVGESCECTIMEWTLTRRVPAHGTIVFSLTPEFNATGSVVRPGNIRTSTLRASVATIVPPRNGDNPRYRFRYATRPVIVSTLAKINNLEDSVLRERSPYSNPSGTNNDTPGDTATIIMDLNHFPTPSGGGDPTAATISFNIGNNLPPGAIAAIGPGPDNGTNDFRVSPTNTTNPAGLIWSAIDSNGNGTIQVKRSLIRGTGNNSRPPNPGRLGVPGAANTLNTSSSAQIRFRFEPYNNRDTQVETIPFNVTGVVVHGSENVRPENIIHPTRLMTIQPSGQANVKLDELDSTGFIHTDGESKRFTVELGGINAADARTNGAANVRVNVRIEGSASRVFTATDDNPRIIKTNHYSLTLPDTVNLPFAIRSGNESRAAELSFTVPLSLFDENSGTDPDAGEETFVFTITARVDDINENTRRTISFRLNPGAKAELVDATGSRIGALIPETSDSTGTLLTYTTRRRNHIASLSGGGVDLHALGSNAETNSGTFKLTIEHYNHAISAPDDFIFVRMDMTPTGAPVGLDTPPPTKFVNSSDLRMITSGDYTVSIPNDTSGVEIVPLTNEEAAFRLKIPLARFLHDDSDGTIPTRGAEEVIMTVKANDVPPTRRQTTTFNINNIVEFDEGRLPGESPFVPGTTFRRAAGNDPGNYGNDRVTFNLLLPEGLQSWIIDGPVDEVTEGRTVRLTTGSVVDESFHVGTLYVTGARNGGYALITLTGTVPSGELTIGPGKDFNVNLSLLTPADGSRNNRSDNFSRHQEALRARQSGFTNSGSTATKTVCLTLSADGNATREFWVARRNGEFPQPPMDVTLAVTDVVALPESCTFPAGDAPSTDSIGTSEFTMLDDGDQRSYLRVAIEPLGTPAGEIDRTMPVEGNPFERPLRIVITPTSSQRSGHALTHVKFKLHARVESGGLTANNAGVGEGSNLAARDPSADFTLLHSGTGPGSTRNRLRAEEILEFNGFGNELVADVCRPMNISELYDRHVWLLPRAANSIDNGDKVINFFITDLFFPGSPGDGDTRDACDPDNPRTIDNGRLTGTQTYPFLAGPSITIRDGPLVPAFTDSDPALEFAGNPSSASADFDFITLNLDYEEHIKNRVVQHPGVALAGVTHFVYASSTNTTTVRRCRAVGDGTDIADNTEIPIAELGLDCDDPNNNGKGFVVEGMDRTADSGNQSVINFRLRNRRNIGPQPVRTTVNSVPATLTFVDAQATNPGIRKLTIGDVPLEPLPTEAPFAVTATLDPGVTDPTVRVVPVDHHSTVNIDGTDVETNTTPGSPNEQSAARSVSVTSGEPFNIIITTERGTTRTYSVTPIILASGTDDPGINEITATVGGTAFHIDLNQVSSTGSVTLPATTTASDSVQIAVVPAVSGSTVGVSDIHDGNPATDDIEYHDTSPGLIGDSLRNIRGFSTGESLFNVSVADEGTARIYTVTVTVPGTDASLDEALTVDGFDVSLDDGTSTGSVTVRDGTRVAVISASPADDRATITAISGPDGAETVTPNDDGTFTADVSGLTVGTNEFTITVIPEDTIDSENPTYTGSAARIYTITVIVPANGASLSSLIVGGRPLTLNADDPFEVDVNLRAGASATEVVATAINGPDCVITDDVVMNRPCTTIIIDGAQARSGLSYPLSSLADGDTINILVTNISAADVVTTRTYLIDLIIPTGDDADNSFRRITVANRSVSGNSVAISGGLTEGVVVVTPTQNFTDARGAIITDITGTDTNGDPLTGGFTGESTPRGERETTISGFLLGRNQISVTIQAVNGDSATHNIRVTVPFSPPHDDSLASTGGLTVNGAVVILDHGQSDTTNTATGTVNLPTGTERATVIATPSQNATDAHGAIVTAITGTDSGLDPTTSTRRDPLALVSDQESNTARGPLTAELTGLTPDNNATNTIVVVVSSPNGARTRTYTIAVTIPAALSENTLLSTVTLTPTGGDPVIADLDLSVGTGTAELPVGTTGAGLRVNLADQLSTVSDISGTNADGDDLTGVALGSAIVPGDRAVQISNFVIGEDNTIMITVTPQTGAMRTYAIRVEIDPVPTGVLTPASPLNISNNTADAGTFSLALTGIPATVNNGTSDVPLTAVDVFFAFTIAGTGADTTLETISDDSTSVETDNFSLTADGGARFFPASEIVGVGATQGFVLRVPGTRFAEGAGSPTTHSAETITFTVTTKNITPANLPYSIRFANSHVAWRTAAGAITDSNLAGPDVSNFSGVTVVFDIASSLRSSAELTNLTITPVGSGTAANPPFFAPVPTYNMSLDRGTTAVTIATTSTDGSTVAFSGTSAAADGTSVGPPLTVNGNVVSGLTPGRNSIVVVVTPENGAVDRRRTYTFTTQVAGFDRATRINRASFAVAGNPDAEVTLTEGPLESNGSGTVEIANTTRATISVVPLTTNAVVTSITNPDGTAATVTGSNPYNADLIGFTTGTNNVVTVAVRHPTELSNIRTYTITVTVRPPDTAAITTVGGSRHSFREGSSRLLHVANFAVNVGPIHADRCLSATINATSVSNITGSNTNGIGGDFVFYIVDQTALGSDSPPGDAVPQGFSGRDPGDPTARTNGISIPLNSNGRGSRSFYIRARSDNTTVDGDKIIRFGISDPDVHLTGCSGDLNPGSPTALAVTGGFTITSVDDESAVGEGELPNAAAELTLASTAIAADGGTSTFTVELSNIPETVTPAEPEGAPAVSVAAIGVEISFRGSRQPVPNDTNLDYSVSEPAADRITSFLDEDTDNGGVDGRETYYYTPNILTSGDGSVVFTVTTKNTASTGVIRINLESVTLHNTAAANSLTADNNSGTLLESPVSVINPDTIAGQEFRLTSADGPTSITTLSDVTLTEGDDSNANVSITFDAPVPTGRRVEYTLAGKTTGLIGNNVATSDSDYFRSANNVEVTLTHVSGNTYTFPVLTSDDSVIEYTEEAILTINAVSWAGSSFNPVSDNTATLTITDNEPATAFSVAFQGDVAGPESGAITAMLVGSANTGVTLERDVSVLVSTRDGTATTADSDYTALDGTTGIVTFLASDHSSANASSTRPIAINPTGDTVVEPNETLELTVSTTDTAATASGTATVTINNDDELTNVRFSTTPETPVDEEDAGTVTYTVSATGAVAAGLDVVVPFTVTGTAISGTDYTPIPTPLEVRFDSDNLRRDINITITNDDAVEIPETIIIALSDPEPESLYALGTPRSHELTINSEDSSNITIAPTDGAEGGTAGSFAISFGNAPAGEEAHVTYSLATTNGSVRDTNYSLSAEAGSNITDLTNTTFTIAADNTGTLTVTAENDDDIYDEIITLTISRVEFDVGHIITTPTESNALRLTDDDSLTVAFTSARQITETDGTGIQLTVSGGTVSSGRGLPTVTVTPTAVTANPQDFTAGAIDVEISKTVTTDITVAVTIPDTSDTRVEDDQTISLALAATARQNEADISVTGTTPITATIVDAPPDLTVALPATAAITEGDAASIPITLTATAPANTVLERAVTVRVSTVPDSATTPADFTGFSDRVITFASNPTPANSFTATTNVNINNDAAAEATTEQFTLNLAQDSPADRAVTIGSPASTTITITDDDRATGFTVSAGNATEGEAATVTVTLNGGVLPAGTILFDYAVAGDTSHSDAAETTDFAAGSNDVTVVESTIAEGRTSFTFDIDANTDGIIENTEGVQVTVSNIRAAEGVTLNGPVSDTFTITDVVAANAFTVSFTGNPNGDEGDAITATLEGVALAGVTLERDVSVLVNTADGSATTTDSDYDAIIDRTITFLASEHNTLDAVNPTTSLQTTDINTTENTVVETNEDLTLTVSTTDTAATIGSSSTATITINNDDELTNVHFSTTPGAEVDENNAGTVTYTVSATGAVAAGLNVVVPFTVDGTATSGTDYTPISTPFDVRFDSDNLSRDINITIINDEAVEIPETIIIALSNPEPESLYALGTPNSHELTINSEDSSNITITPTDGAEGGTAGSFAISFDNAPAGETAHVTYSLATTNGSVRDTNYTLSAEAGSSNITNLTNTTFTIAADNAGTLTVTAEDDNDIYDEIITLTISMVVFDVGHIINSPTESNALRLTDADSLTVAFTSARQITETDGTGIQLTVSGGTVSSGRGLPTVTVTPTPVTANPQDFTAGTIDVEINKTVPEDITVAVTIPGTLDTRVEDDQTASLALAATARQNEADISVTGTTPITATIMDAPPALTVALPATAGITEGDAASVAITLTATAPPNTILERAVTVRVSTTPGTATAGSDFTAFSNRVVNIGPNLTANTSFTATTSVDITDDAVAEATTEQFALNLAQDSPADRAVTISPSATTTTITITDDDRAMGFMSVVANPASVTEGATTTVTVNLSGALPPGDLSTVSFDYTITGTGTDGVEPDAPGSQRDIIAGETGVNPTAIAGDRMSFTFTVDTRADDAIENTETAQVTVRNISAAEGVSINASAGTTFDITDDEPTTAFTVSFVGDSNGDENGANISTMLRGVASAGVTLERNIDVLVASGGAADTATIADSDYTALDSTTGVVTFLASEHGTAAATSTQPIEINPTGDAVVEPDETLTLTVSTADTAATASGTATVTINNDDALSNVRFTAARSTFAEASGSHDIIVQADGAIATGHSVRVAFTVGTETGAATPGTDYTAITNLMVTLGPSLSQTIRVGILDNPDDVEPDETVTLTLVKSGPDAALYEVGSNNRHELTIIDDSIIDVQFTLTDSEVAEADITHDITVDAVGTIAAGHSVDVFFTTVGGTATLGAGGDYTAISPASMVTFDSNNLSRTISVTIRDDDIVELRETIQIRLTDSAHSAADPRPYEVDTNRTHTITITDSDTITVQFEDADSSMAESVTTRNIDVTITNGSIAANHPAVDVPFTVGGDATSTPGPNNDYTAITPLMVTFDSGETRKTISVTIRNDAAAESNEDITLTLTAAAPGADYTLGTNTEHTLTINDDDTISVTFDGPTSMNPEADATRTIRVSYTGTIPGGTTVSVPFTVATSSSIANPNPATPNADYNAITNFMVILPAGTNQSATISIVIRDDTIVEPDETIFLTLMDSGTDAHLYNLGDNATHTHTIENNDTITVQFAQADRSMAESVTTRTIAVTASGTIASGHTVAVPFTVAPRSTATLGASDDYTAISPASMVSFGFGETSKSISVTIRDDNIVEPNENIILTLTAPAQGADYTLGGNTEHTLTIENNDTITVQFEDPDSSMAESVTTRTINVTASGTIASGHTVDVPFTVDPGSTATLGASGDYTAISPASMVRFGTGETSKTISVTIRNDANAESNENIIFALTTPAQGADYRLGTNTEHTLIIEDDDAIRVQFAMAASEEAEGNGNVTHNIVVSYTGNIPDGDEVEVPFSVSGGTTPATSGTDFNAISPTMVTFDSTNRNQNISVTIRPDNIVEPDETIELTLTDEGMHAHLYNLTGNTQHTFTITDPDTISVQFNDSTSEVTEANTTETINVRATGTIAAGHSVAVDFTDSGGSAISGTDYTAISPTTVTFRPGALSQNISVAILDNPSVEPDKDIVLTLTDSGTNNDYELGDTTIHTLDIIDPDTITVSFALGQDSTTEADVATSHNIAIGYTGTIAAGHSVEVDFTDSGGSATSGEDYTALPSSVVFTSAATSQNINVAITGDNDAESNETIILTLTAPAQGADYALTSPAAHTLTIIDDDTIIVQFDAPTSSATEAAAAQTIRVNYIGTIAAGTTVSVPFTVGTGTNPATPNADYTAITNLTIILPAGTNQSASISVTIREDTTVEPDETIVLTLMDSGGDSHLFNLGTNATHTHTITNDDTITVEFAAADSTGAEPAAMQARDIQVRYTGTIAPGHDVEVSFSDSGGTAASGTDYNPISPTTVTFDSTSRSKNISVTILPDDIVEPDETIILTLTDSGTDNDYVLTSTVADRTHTLHITDPDTIIVSFALARSDPMEADVATTSNIAIRYTGTIAPLHSVEVDFTDSGGSATSGEDYNALPSSVVFDNTSRSQNITVTIMGDNNAEANETIILTLMDVEPNDYALTSPAVHTLTIIDDDAISVTFDESTSMDPEAAATRIIQVNYSGSIPEGTTVSVPFTVATGPSVANPDPATSGADYNAISPTTVTFDSTSQRANISVVIREDDLVEPDETIFITLMDSGPDMNLYNPGAIATHTYTIENDDTISVEFEEAESSMAESVTTRTIAVTASGTIAANHPGVEVDFTVGGDAISTPGADNDYTAINPLMVTLSAGVNPSADISVTIRDDDEEEEDETIILTLDPPEQGDDYTLGTNTTHTLIIENASDDSTLASLMVDWEDVPLNHDDNGLTGTGTVIIPHAIMHVPIVATATDPAAMILSIAGQPIDDPGQTATLMDVLVSNGDTFDVVVRAENEDRRTYTIIVVIRDTLRPMVTVSPTTSTIPETDGNVTIDVRLTDSVSEEVRLPFVITPTSPADANDYEIDFPSNCNACTETGGTLVFTTNQQRQQITFSATEDFDAEPDQTILFKLNSGTQEGGVVVPNTTQATIIIEDDDTPPTEVSVSASRQRISEGSHSSIITVSLNSAAVAGPDITLPFRFQETGEHPATFGANADAATADYFATCPGSTDDADPVACSASDTLTFTPGQRTKTITVTGIDDTPDNPEEEDTEVDETFTFKLTPGNEEGVIVAAADEVTLTIARTIIEAMETMREVETVVSLTGTQQVGMITGLIRQRFSDTVPTPSFGGGGGIGSGTTGTGSTLNAASLVDNPDFGAPSYSLALPDNPENLGDLLDGFGFNTQAPNDAGGIWSMWVRGQYSNMEGTSVLDNTSEDTDPTLSYDGNATGVGLGMEWAGNSTIIGIAADYIDTVLDISSTSENITLSKYKESILLAAPYFAIRRDKSHSFWMSLGVGTGNAQATLDGVTRAADVKAGFVNAGVDITLAENAHEFVVGLSGSAVRKETDPFVFDTATIPEVTVNSYQARGDITYAHAVGVSGGTMRPYLGISTIHDFGDKSSEDEHALGLRSGITFRGLNLDLNLEGSSEILRDDHKQWTISGNARFHSNPNRSGLSLSLDGSRGADVGAGIEGSYGLPIRRFHPDAMLTPFAALRREDDGNEVVSGMRFSLGDDLDIDLQNTRRPHDDNETAVNLRFRREF